RVAGRRLDDAGPVAGELDCTLQGRLVNVMSAPAASARVRRLASGREDVLPPQVTAGVRVLASQGMRQMHLTKATGQISLVDHLHPAYLSLNRSSSLRGSGTRRSFPPLPLRTQISFLPKSTSFTLSRTHSMSR